MLKRQDIDKVLKKAGWVISHGTKHDFAKHPQKLGVRIQLPRHAEVNENTANGILEAAGLK